MCGRFVQALSESDISETLASAGYALVVEALRASYAENDFVQPPDFVARYNVAPTQKVIGLMPMSTTVGVQLHTLYASTLRWGLQRHETRSGGRPIRPINARIETIASKSFFRSAYLDGRCVVPANGYYEWQQSDTAPSKKPFYINDLNAPLLLFAAVTQRNAETGDQEFATLTTTAHHGLSHIHHRQPVTLSPNTLALWLGENGKPLRSSDLEYLSRPQPLRAQEADPRVNSVRNDWPELIAKPHDDDPLYQ